MELPIISTEHLGSRFLSSPDAREIAVRLYDVASSRLKGSPAGKFTVCAIVAMLSLEPQRASWDMSEDLKSFVDEHDSQTLALQVKRVLQYRQRVLRHITSKVYARDVVEILDPYVTLAKERPESTTAHLRLSSSVDDVSFPEPASATRRIAVFGAR